MIKTYSIRLLVGAAFLYLGTDPLLGQATFSVGSSPLTASDIGIADLAGVLTLHVVSGTSVAAPFRIEYSAVITNNLAAEISVTGTGGLAGIAAAPSIDSDKRILTVSVPAGGVAGDQLTIEGVRVALAGGSQSRVTATVTSAIAAGNAVVAGQGTAVVIASIVSPFSVDLSSSPALAYTNGIIINPSTSIGILEGYAGAFTSSVGSFGQTVPARIRVTPFPSIPAGASLTFGASATSASTGATITTTSGLAETVPRADGSTDVVYNFTAAAGSNITVESFSISITLGIAPPAETGTVTFQAALVPVGAVTPDAQFPSTDIPRYVERLVPDETELSSGSVPLAFPFRAASEATYTGIAITNPQNFRVKVTLTALDAGGVAVSGPNITNPVTLTVPRKGQVGRLASEIFGSGFNASTAGTIAANGRTTVLPGFYIVGDNAGTRLDGAPADLSPRTSFIIPAISRQGPQPLTLLELYNPGSAAANVVLSLLDSAGRSVSSRGLIVGPGATLSRQFQEIFDAPASTFTGGYIRGNADVAVSAREHFGNSAELNILTAQLPLQRSRFHVAHFATGGGFITELNVINVDVSLRATLQLTAFDDNGDLITGAANPVTLVLEPGSQIIRTVSDLFKIPSGPIKTGYIRVDVETSHAGPFIMVPALAGFVRFASPDFSRSASLPLSLPPSSDFVYSHIAQNQSFYTGVALLNANAERTTYTLEAFTDAGILIGTFSGALEPGQKIAKLIFELISSVNNLVGGYIRVRSNRPLTSFSLFGDTLGQSLSTIPLQRID